MEYEFEDTFDGDALDGRRWLPYYLPHWSSRAQAAARYRVGDGCLRLLIEADQQPWCPEFDGEVRVSSLQTAHHVGQHRFNPEAVVREQQENVRLYTPRYGVVEIRCRAIADPRNMVALWMIGYEDRPERSAEICVCEIFGSEVRPDEALVGVGVHPFGDPEIVDDFSKVRVAADACEFHTYAADWTPERVRFLIDGDVVKTVAQSPAYPMQLMLSVYEFEPGGTYPKEFVVDHVRGYGRA